MIVENNIRLLKNIDYPLTLISDNQEIQEIDDNLTPENLTPERVGQFK